MRELDKYLFKWVEKGFLSQDQSEKIKEFEQNETKTKGKSWVLYGFVILGVSIIGIGIVSMIAMNWEEISPSMKLGCDFIFLALLGLGIYKAHQINNDVLFDSLSTLFMISCLASIGLISQIYHTGGEPYQALLLWSVITFPLTLFGRKGFLYHLWVFGFLFMCFAWSLSTSSWWYENRSLAIWKDHYFPFYFAFPLFSYSMGNICLRINGLKRMGSIFNFWAVISSFIAIGGVDFSHSFNSVSFNMKSFSPVFSLTGLGLITLFFRDDLSKKSKIITSLIILAPIIIFLPAIVHFFSSPSDVLYSFRMGNRTTSEIFGAFYTVML
ncbi:MAG: DUF2157 domain-containing protein, partial [Proteobacteria bacterium]|nr:DUF2157 domain-containing protein [Pseudomonadota bacterium]